MDDLEFQILAYKSAIRSAALSEPSKLTELASFFHEAPSIPDAIRAELEARCLAFLNRKDEARELLLTSLNLSPNKDLKVLNDELLGGETICNLENDETALSADVTFCRSLIARCIEILEDTEMMSPIKIHQVGAHLRLLADVMDPTFAKFEKARDLASPVGQLIRQLPHTYGLGFRRSTVIALCAATASEFRDESIAWRAKFHFSAADVTPLLRQ